MRLSLIVLLFSLTATTIAVQVQVKSATQNDVIAGTTVVLKCELRNFKGEDEGEYVTWKRNGAEVIAVDDDIHSDNYRLSVNNHDAGVDAKMSELTIVAVEPSDDGNYTCGAYVESDEDQVKFRISVQSPPAIHVTPDAWPYKVQAGSAVSLVCHVDGGNPYPNVEWKKKNGQISTAASMQGRKLHIPAVTSADSGTYECHATNLIGTLSKSLQMVVTSGSKQQDAEKVLPWVNATETYVPVVEGAEVNISCIYGGNPEPDLRWHFNGHRLSLADEFVRNNFKQLARSEKEYNVAILQVTGMTADYYGDYSCQVDNELGSARAAIYASGFPGPADISYHGGQLLVKISSPDQLRKLGLFRKKDDESKWTKLDELDVTKDYQTGRFTWEIEYDIKKWIAPGKQEFQVQGLSRNWGSNSAKSVLVEKGEQEEEMPNSTRAVVLSSAVFIVACRTLF